MQQAWRWLAISARLPRWQVRHRSRASSSPGPRAPPASIAAPQPGRARGPFSSSLSLRCAPVSETAMGCIDHYGKGHCAAVARPAAPPDSHRSVTRIVHSRTINENRTARYAQLPADAGPGLSPGHRWRGRSGVWDRSQSTSVASRRRQRRFPAADPGCRDSSAMR